MIKECENILFLLTPLREGRQTGDFKITCEYCKFLLTPLREGRQSAVIPNVLPDGKFLLTPLREGRQCAKRDYQRIVSFLLTPLREGRPVLPFLLILLVHLFLLTPLREGRRGDFSRVVDFVYKISTHAPTRGATVPRCRWGGTPCKISTHAPTRGATCLSCEQRCTIRFLLTPLREGRLTTDIVNGKVFEKFLLTPLREGRQYAAAGKRSGDPDFYSRPYARGDHYFRFPLSRIVISTHAPTRGATIISTTYTYDIRNFYSRPYARGDAIALSKSKSEFSEFLLTPLREGRQKDDRALYVMTRVDFYSRPYARGDKK